MMRMIFRLLSNRPSSVISLLVLCLVLAFTVTHTTFGAKADSITVYSGRSEELVGPLMKKFREQTGFDLRVRYGKTTEMAATILEEGKHSPADVFLAQDAGALGALARSGRLAPLAKELLSMVEPRFRSPEGLWVGVSGRARTVVYNTKVVKENDLPKTLFGFCDPRWNGRIGWAPQNGSFQAFITALRVLQGEERTRNWLSCIRANEAKNYPKNTSIVEAVGTGEIDVGFVNHYYLFRFLKERGKSFPVRNHMLQGGDAGALINVAGVGILKTSRKRQVAEQFIRFLLSPETQQYFTSETYEYPLAGDIPLNPLLEPLEKIKTPDIDLNDLQDLDGTLKLLQSMGIIY